MHAEGVDGMKGVSPSRNATPLHIFLKKMFMALLNINFTEIVVYIVKRNEKMLLTISCLLSPLNNLSAFAMVIPMGIEV